MNTTTRAETLGSLQVCGFSGPITTERTLHAVETKKYGLVLYDRLGVSVSPRSQRLGYASNGGKYSRYLVNDDCSVETINRLRAAGYPVVSHGSQAPDSPLLSPSTKSLSLAEILSLDPEPTL